MDRRGPTFCFIRMQRVHRVLESDGYSHELDVAISVPDEQFASGADVLARLVVDPSIRLDCYEVLLLGVSGAVHVGHPVPRRTSAIHEVTQLTVLKDLNDEDSVIKQRT